MEEKRKVGRPPNPGLNGFYIPFKLLENLGVSADTPRSIIRNRLIKASELFKQVTNAN